MRPRSSGLGQTPDAQPAQVLVLPALSQGKRGFQDYLLPPPPSSQGTQEERAAGSPETQAPSDQP